MVFQDLLKSDCLCFNHHCVNESKTTAR